jgi:hypothetical protein
MYMNKIKQFLVENGFTSLIALAVAIGGFVLGFKLIGAIAFGYFLGRNHEIIKGLYKQYLAVKVKDIAEDILKKK